MGGMPGHPWKTEALHHGGIVQAGVPMHCGADWFDTRGFITRAVVVKTYYSDDQIWDDRGWGKDNVRGVCCDVRTYGRYSRPLWKVPVLQRAHGLHDEDVFVPRESTMDISGTGATLATFPSGTTGTKPTPAESLDGDHVLVGFLEGNPDTPVIFPFCLPHPSSSRKLKESDGRVKRIRHAGVVVQWTEDGNFTIDATDAKKEALGAGGTEVSNSGTGGKITIKTEDVAGDQSSVYLDELGGVKITDGSGGFIAWTKASQEIEINSGVTVKVVSTTIDNQASATFKVTAPTQTFTGTSVSFTPSASFVINNAIPAGITLGTGTPDTLVKMTQGWLPFWTSIMTSAVNSLKEKYDPTKVPPPPPTTTGEVVGDLFTFFNALYTAFNTFLAGAGLVTSQTLVTKAA